MDCSHSPLVVDQTSLNESFGQIEVINIPQVSLAFFPFILQICNEKGIISKISTLYSFTGDDIVRSVCMTALWAYQVQCTSFCSATASVAQMACPGVKTADFVKLNQSTNNKQIKFLGFCPPITWKENVSILY